MIHFILKKAIPGILLGMIIISPAGAKEDKQRKVKYLPNPNWVHPAERANYPGYELQKKARQTGRDWRYLTNRPNGNIRGGGTTEYKEYRPFHSPAKPKRKKQKK